MKSFFNTRVLHTTQAPSGGYNSSYLFYCRKRDIGFRFDLSMDRVDRGWEGKRIPFYVAGGDES
jgi:hypothetical protein